MGVLLRRKRTVGRTVQEEKRLIQLILQLILLGVFTFFTKLLRSFLNRGLQELITSRSVCIALKEKC